MPIFADRLCQVISVTDPYGHNLGILDRSHYFFFQVVPHLHSEGSVVPVPDSLLRKFVAPGIERGPLDL
jgi:hypothetical protein